MQQTSGSCYRHLKLCGFIDINFPNDIKLAAGSWVALKLMDTRHWTPQLANDILFYSGLGVHWFPFTLTNRLLSSQRFYQIFLWNHWQNLCFPFYLLVHSYVFDFIIINNNKEADVFICYYRTAENYITWKNYDIINIGDLLIYNNEVTVTSYTILKEIYFYATKYYKI